MSKAKDSPDRLFRSSIIRFTSNPPLGALVLQTDEGTIAMAIDESAARQLQEALDLFLMPLPTTKRLSAVGGMQTPDPTYIIQNGNQKEPAAEVLGHLYDSERRVAFPHSLILP
jgi:hypothetical protein